MQPSAPGKRAGSKCHAERTEVTDPVPWVTKGFVPALAGGEAAKPSRKVS
jgi:hypothetical protein